MSDSAPNQEKNQPRVLAAINAVQKALKAGIPKDQKNTMQGYSFRGIDDILNIVGPLLPEHGLVILPRYSNREVTEHKNAKGNTMFHVSLLGVFTFKATSDGSCEVVEMFGEAMDSSDKATNKAMSAAFKYACIQTFSIAVNGEPDADADSPTVGSGEVPKPHKPRPTLKPIVTRPVFTSLADDVTDIGTPTPTPAEIEDEAIMQRYLASKEAV